MSFLRQIVPLKLQFLWVFLIRGQWAVFFFSSTYNNGDPLKCINIIAKVN